MKYLAVLLVLLLVTGGLIVLNTIYPFLPTVANKTNDIVQGVTDNWQGFLFGKKEPEMPPVEDVSTEAELEARIKAEVDKAVAAKLAEMTSTDGGLTSGLVVLPPGAQASTSLLDITNSFSDEVVVLPDASGQSGVITPIFKSGQGDSYLYILTPIKN